MNTKGEREVFASIIMLVLFGIVFYAILTTSSDNAFTEAFCQDNDFQGFRDEPVHSCFRNEGSKIIYQRIDCVAYGFYPEERIRRCVIKVDINAT